MRRTIPTRVGRTAFPTFPFVGGRTIPTRVGRTAAYAKFFVGALDHPHTRGENLGPEMPFVRLRGPSPHAWGEHASAHEFSHPGRTIPTRVGRTLDYTRDAPMRADHPHTRGENRSDGCVVSRLFGPSPHAWGEQAIDPDGDRVVRTIPTRVGRTDYYVNALRAAADHPHTRGENSTPSRPITADIGPSPHAWGEPHVAPSAARHIRTIPTRVGRTVSASRAARRLSDHPHTRGENGRICKIFCGRTGPSPHAWGELSVNGERDIPARTIPTRVGRTASPCWSELHMTDHPHTRGENGSRRSQTISITGPSPHAWGELS